MALPLNCREAKRIKFLMVESNTSILRIGFFAPSTPLMFIDRMPDLIPYEDEGTAEPAFRVLAYISGSMNDPANSAALIRLFDLFMQRYAGDLMALLMRDVGIQPRPRSVTPETVAAIRQWLGTTTKVFGASLRANAPPTDDLNAPRIPHLRFDEDDQKVLVELSVPYENPDLVAFADAATDILTTVPLICAVMGMGFHMPAGVDSRSFILPCTTARYRAAIEILLTNPRDGITLEGSAFRWARHPTVKPGVADIGWRTIVGAPFMERLPGLSVDAPATLAMSNGMAVLTAGPAPIWGDVNAAEDIDAYRAVARALTSVRFPREVALKGFFGGAEGNPEHVERLDAYLARFQ